MDLTSDKLEEFRQVFKMFDKNGDGRVTAEELGAVMQTWGQAPTRDELMDMINEMDQDGNGTVELNEFVSMMSKKMKQSEDDRELKEAFQVFDTDRDGYITAPELGVIMRNLGENLSEKEICEMIHEADLDGDGKVNFDEFVAMMNQ
uniref:Calmodulin n=1 Tax=Panagrellus redivivus TaxID=6233 RepID=A0A7E4ZS23_PANRE